MKQKQFITLFSFLLVILTSCATVSNTSAEETKTSAEEAKNIQRVRTYWEEVWNKGNLQAVADFYHPAAKHGDDFTIEGFQKGVQSQREAIPDLKVIIHDIFAAGNRVITEVTYTGKHTGRRFFGQDPLDKEVNLPGIDIFTFKDDKCISHQHVADHLPMIRQIGLKLVPTRDLKITEQDIKKASHDYVELSKRLSSGKTHEELVNSGDIEALNKLLADEYSYTDPKGVVYNKTEELNFYKNNSIVLNSLELNDQKINIDGNTAIENGVIRFKGTNAGKPLDFTKRYTTTWIWRGGRWQILADHASKVEN
jgi:predicted ester cyclase